MTELNNRIQPRDFCKFCIQQKKCNIEKEIKCCRISGSLCKLQVCKKKDFDRLSDSLTRWDKDQNTCLLNGQSFIDIFPDEILMKIAYYMDGVSLVLGSLTCRKVFQITNTEWKRRWAFRAQTLPQIFNPGQGYYKGKTSRESLKMYNLIIHYDIVMELKHLIIIIEAYIPIKKRIE